MVRECYGGYRRHKTALGRHHNLYTTALNGREFLKIQYSRALIRVSVGSLKLNRAPKGGP
jgi:hypothetical protein